MAEAKHTPGPWKLVNGGLPSARIEGADGQGVCTWARYPMDSCSDGDAMLVAAAPEMLALLRRLEVGADGWCSICESTYDADDPRNGHAEDCEMWLLLSRFPEEVA